MALSTTEVTRLTLTRIAIPFKVAVKHASATRTCTESILVEAHSRDGEIGYGEGCPRAYVTGETMKSCEEFFSRHSKDLQVSVSGIDSLKAWTQKAKPDIDRNPAAWCAIELALLDLIGKVQRECVEAMLRLPLLGRSYCYSAILGDADVSVLKGQLARYRRMGLSDFKLKISGDLKRDQDKFDLLSEEPVRVRLDANNAWASPAEAIRYLRSIDLPVLAVEEPLHQRSYPDLRAIADATNMRVILDESFTRCEQFGVLAPPFDPWIINIRVSKMGGLMRSLDVAERAAGLGIPLVIGAHVGETSLLARAALTVATAARESVLAQEGAFGTYLLQRDICAPALMFGHGGQLDPKLLTTLGGKGFGLSMLETTHAQDGNGRNAQCR